jgi:NAD(P)-dependent dehydrogenase (short-subunit alcohol dehydrogenase family)
VKKNNNNISRISTVGCALITGGAKRIGSEIAIYLAKKGYDLIITYHKSKLDAEKLVKKIKTKYQVKCTLIRCDLTKIDQTKILAKKIKSDFANCNLLINNASIFNRSKFLTSSEEEFFNNLNIHLISPLILAKEFAKNAVKNSQIINILDKNITRFDTSYFYYLFSKKTLAELTKMLAVEIAPEVRVNGIAPGFILNSVNEKNPQNETEILTKKIPLKTKGEISNIIQAVAFLLENSFVNGQIIFVDGGASLNHAG